LSALATFRSADSARAAHRSTEETAQRVALLTAANAANEVLAELQRVTARAAELHTACVTLDAFSGSYENSGIKQVKAEVAERAKRAAEISEHARLFVNGRSRLQDAPPADIDRVQVRLSSALLEVRAIREELDRKHASIEAQNAQFRERALKR
jgi:hypothetical protein